MSVKRACGPFAMLPWLRTGRPPHQFYLHLRPLIHHGISAPHFLGDEAKRGLRFCILFRFGGDGFAHQAVLQLQGVSDNSTQSWHHLLEIASDPTGEGLGPTRLFPPCFRLRLWPVLGFSNPTWPFWVFMEASLHRHDWLNPWPLVTELILQPPPPQGLGGLGLKIPIL